MPLGRPKVEVDEEVLMDLLSQGWTKKDTAAELGISVPTLQQRILDLKKREGVVLQYRALQSLELTEIEAQILGAITPERIHEASLRDLVQAYKILKDKELVAEGRPTEIKGLVGYLMHLEKEFSTEGPSTGESKVIDIVEERLASEDQEDIEACYEEAVDNEDQEFEVHQSTEDGSIGDSPSVGSPLYPLDELPDL